MSQCAPTPCVREMPPFTDRQNDELRSFIKMLTGRSVVPIEPLETSIEKLQFPADRKKCPLKTAGEAILLNDMFASFLSGKPNHVIAVSGGFGPGGQYYVVGAGNTGKKGVRRPSDELSTALARACKEFTLGSTKSLNPDDMSAILVASLDICHAEVARRLKVITPAVSNTGSLNKRRLQPYTDFPSDAAALKDNLERWKELESQKKTEVATSYGQILKIASEQWDKIKDSGPVQYDRELKSIYDLNTIAKGLQLLRRFPRGTQVVFDWPQGPVNGDRFGCQPIKAQSWQTMIEDLISKSIIGDHELRKKMLRMWKEAIGENQCVKAIQHTSCQLHCEIYLALYILFSDSDVRFHSFLVEEKKRLFAVGCSKESCVGCWDILRGLFRQDSRNQPQYVCRTRRSRGYCYETWCLTPDLKTLPPSLRQTVTGPRQTQMLKCLNNALNYSHQEFKQRVESSM